MSWPASIFDRSSTSLIRPSRCWPLAWTRSSALVRLVRQLAVEAVGQQLGVAEDGVQRRAQLVAHVGEELRLVLARDLELAALLLDLAEQPRVLDRQHGLRREGLQEVDGRFREQARLPAAHHERADDAVGAQQRHDEQRRDSRLAGRCRWTGDARLVGEVRHLDRLAPLRRVADRSLAEPDGLPARSPRSAPRSCRRWRAAGTSAAAC